MIRGRPDVGVAIPEILIALVVSTMAAAVALELVDAAQQAAVVMPSAVDVQQRLRVGAGALIRDIGAAGAGLDGGTARGPLVWYLPPVIPRRMGLLSPDPPIAARADAVTLLAVPVSTQQTSTAAALAPGGALVVTGGAACPGTASLCGLAAGTDVVVFDRLGAFDVFTVTDASGRLVSHGSSGRVYDPGSPVSAISETTYYFDTASRQLRQYDGYQTDVPLIDDVVGVRFEYLGTPDPPTRPKPPVPGLENCLYDAGGTPKPLPILTTTDGSLVSMPLTMLSDGPWCGSGATMFDADLLRVRAVKVTLRVQASLASVRGSGGAFARPGVANAGWRLVPDAAVTFVIRPRNLHQ